MRNKSYSLFSVILILVVLKSSIAVLGQSPNYCSFAQAMTSKWGPDVLLWRDNITKWSNTTSVGIDLIYEAMPTIQNPNYPRLERDDIAVGLRPHGYRGDLSRVKTALRRAHTENKLNIAVLGGSVTYGVGAGENECGKWTNQLTQIMEKVLFPQMKINITNLGIRAASSAVQASSHFSLFLPVIETAHLVLVDITVNDYPSSTSTPDRFHEGRKLMELLLQFSPSNTGVIYIETFSRNWLSQPTVIFPSQINECIIGKRIVQPANYRGLPPMHTQCNRDRQKLDISSYFHWCPLLELQIPIISYVDISCRFSDAIWRKKINTLFLWGMDTHPSIKVHMYVAEIVGLSIFELYRETIDGRSYPIKSADLAASVNQWDDYILTHPVHFTEIEDKRENFCNAHPTTRLPHVRGQPFEPSSNGVDWSYGEDVKGKPGWIAYPISALNHTHQDSERRQIRFGLNASLQNGHGIIKLELLNSYSDDMGVLSCCVNCDGPEFTPAKLFDTKIKEHQSQTFIASLPFKSHQHTTSITSFNIVRCQANSGKVKIVSLIGC